MASTNKTAVLKLNQWVASDPVLREDFNADNAKLDDAVQMFSLVFLKRGTMTENARFLHVDMSDLDLTQYQALHLVVNPIGPTVAGTSVGLQFTMNNLSSVNGAYNQATLTSGTFYPSKTLDFKSAMPDGGTVITADISLTPRLPGTITCRGSYSGTSSICFFVDPTYLSKSNLVNLQVFPNADDYQIQAGSQYVLYGLKG